MENVAERNKFNRWYKDRDFPEVKAGNDDYLATIVTSVDLQRVIDRHNAILDAYIELWYEVRKLRALVGKEPATEQENG
jgi:hypothetical protein